MSESHTEILIVGGGTGGVAAALAATALGRRVTLTEPTAWLGGQLTSQAVPPDENPWIEMTGCTARYRRYRDLVRRYYREHYPLTAGARRNPRLNPGGGNVSALCHEPRVGVAAIDQMLAFARTRGLIRVLHHCEPVEAHTDGDRVTAVTIQRSTDGHRETIQAEYVIDATELGDLLPLAGVEYVTGAESQADTREPHAAEIADPENVQAISWCFAMSHDPTPGADHTADPPAQYDRWRSFAPDLTPPWPGPMFGWKTSYPKTLETVEAGMQPPDDEHPGGGGLWNFRKIVDHTLYAEGDRPREVTLVNWPMIDYTVGNLIDKPADDFARYGEEARQMSLSFFHWMQTEAPRHDDGSGYPGLYLRPDITGTDDGLAMHPYIREARRIKALFTVTEHHMGVEARTGHKLASRKPIPIEELPFPRDAMPRAEHFEDSVGIGAYRIDLHPSTGGDNYIDVAALPFEIPLGALIPQRVTNLLPAAKNLGGTHISNGALRLHPVEWNIGEAAGLLAAHCLAERTQPHAVHADRDRRADFQRRCDREGIEREWPLLWPM